MYYPMLEFAALIVPGGTGVLTPSGRFPQRCAGRSQLNGRQ